MIKKTLFVAAIIITVCSCTSSQDTTTTEKAEKPEVPMDRVNPDKDSRGNYVK